MTRLTVLCFAGTYGLALASELLRLRGRADVWSRLLPGFLIALGWLVQSAYLANLAIQKQVVPLTSIFESMLVLGWVLAAIALFLEFYRQSKRPTLAGPVVLALALVVLTVAGLWAPRSMARRDDPGALALGGMIHGLFQTLGAVGTCLAFAFGLMYLIQARRLKRKQKSRWALPLPSLEQSDRWHRVAILTAFPLLTAGLISGLALVIVVHQAGASTFRWTDPKVFSTVALWVVSAALLFARFQPEWQGRRLMILTVLAFAMLAFAMVGVGVVLPTAHGGLSMLPGQSTSATNQGASP
jgi:ABC-type transport system involved in cytochrome c biogenesis permease subunit